MKKNRNTKKNLAHPKKHQKIVARPFIRGVIYLYPHTWKFIVAFTNHFGIVGLFFPIITLKYMLQKWMMFSPIMAIRRNVLFLGVFFRKFAKNRKK